MQFAFDRIQQMTGLKTQVQLAEALKIRQSSISDAKRRGAVPDAWLVTLLEKYSLNPEWIKHGTGSIYLMPATESFVPPAAPSHSIAKEGNERAAELMVKAAKIIATVLGMFSENMQRQAVGSSMAYDDSDFINAVDSIEGSA